jgi:hypothetical protein
MTKFTFPSQAIYDLDGSKGGYAGAHSVHIYQTNLPSNLNYNLAELYLNNERIAVSPKYFPKTNTLSFGDILHTKDLDIVTVVIEDPHISSQKIEYENKSEKNNLDESPEISENLDLKDKWSRKSSYASCGRGVNV